jgi:hypothetical protein
MNKTPCSVLKVNWHFGGTYRLHLQGENLLATSYTLVSYSTLKMGIIICPETSVHFQRTKRRCIPADRNLHNHMCENHKSYISTVWSLAIQCFSFPTNYVVTGKDWNYAIRTIYFPNVFLDSLDLHILKMKIIFLFVSSRPTCVEYLWQKLE